MPTDNPKISAYVPQLLYDRFKQFQDEQNLSMSQAVIVLLAEYFGLQQAIKGITDEATVGNITLPRIENIEQQLSQVLLDLEKLKSTKQTTSSLLVQTEQPSLPLELNLKQNNKIKISAAILAKRFTVTPKTIRNHSSSPEKFLTWSKSKDPDQIAWEVFRGDKGYEYCPVGETFSELLSELQAWIDKSVKH